MSKIGENIKKYRILRGLSQEELAHRLGYKGKSTISNWETGANFPSQEKQEELIQILGIDANTLYGWEDPEQIKSDAEKLGNMILSDHRIKKLVEALNEMADKELDLVLSFASHLKKGADKE